MAVRGPALGVAALVDPARISLPDLTGPESQGRQGVAKGGALYMKRPAPQGPGRPPKALIIQAVQGSATAAAGTALGTARAGVRQNKRPIARPRAWLSTMMAMQPGQPQSAQIRLGTMAPRLPPR